MPGKQISQPAGAVSIGDEVRRIDGNLPWLKATLPEEKAYGCVLGPRAENMAVPTSGNGPAMIPCEG